MVTAGTITFYTKMIRFVGRDDNAKFSSLKLLQHGVACDIKLLDFQIMRYSSPICDLAYYIFGCTTKELRDKHYKEFMDVYYSTLSQFIKR